MGNFFDQFDPKPGAKPSASVTDTPSIRSAQAAAQTGQANVATAKGAAELPFVGPTARAKLTAAETAAKTAELALEAHKRAAWLQAKNAKDNAEEATKQIDEMLGMPGLRYVVGSSWAPLHGVFGKGSVDVKNEKGEISSEEKPRIPIGGTEANDFLARYKQVMGGAFLEARGPLKGSGAVTDYEGKQAVAAKNRMDLSTSVPEFKKASEEYKYWLNRRAQVMQASAMGPEEAQKELNRRAQSFKILSVTPLGK